MSPIILRDYQEEALERVAAAAARGVRRQLGVAATGLGKTILFCALARRMGVRTLVIAHRDELIEQAAAKVAEVWPGVDVGVVKGNRNEVHSQVVVASVQTLSRPSRLTRLLAPTIMQRPPFGLVVVDEAHHAAAPTYRAVTHALRCDEDDGPLLLGVTATPDRGDGKGLDDLFQEVTFAYDLRWGIAQEHLCDLRGLRVRLDADLRAVKVSRGDYAPGSAGQWLEDADAPTHIVAAWMDNALGRRTLVFTPTVASARAVQEAFAKAGVSAGMVDGAMPIDDRRAALAAYSAGRYDVMVNCMVLTEGYDEPRTDCIVVARPTKSRALYTQMVGRGTRRHPEKADCLVIDVVGVTDVHELVTAPSLFGIEKPERVWDGDATLTEALHEQIERHEAEGRLLATEAELFRKVRQAGFAWVKVVGQARYALSLFKAGHLVMVQLPDGSWRAGHQDGAGVKRVLIDRVSLEMAQGVAEDFARKRAPMELASSATDATWRMAPPSAKQIAAARKAKITIPPGATKGEVSDLLGAKFAARKART